MGTNVRSDNADKPQPCQGPCQHTSCRGCRFEDGPPQCDKCGRDDFACLRRYGKCVRRDVCNRRNQFPCKATFGEEIYGKFKCLVPECL